MRITGFDTVVGDVSRTNLVSAVLRVDEGLTGVAPARRGNAVETPAA